MRWRAGTRFAAALGAGFVVAACATIGEIDLSDETCATNFRDQVASILSAQGEPPEAASSLAQRAVEEVGFGGVGLRPFVVGSRTTDYTFFIQKKKDRCLLRLVSRRRGFETYTNDITYIATRALPACRCTAE